MTDHLTPQMLALYLGCECEITDNTQNSFTGILSLMDLVDFNAAQVHIKPILRPLADVTDAEWSDLDERTSMFPDVYGVGMLRDNFMNDVPKNRCGWQLINEAIIELRKMNIDMDGLLEKGLAIDATKINKP